MMISVRAAARSDVPWLLEQLRAFAVFYGTRRPLFPEDMGMAHALVERFVSDPESYPFFVAAHDDTPVGFIGGAVHTHPFNPALLVLSELFWWVETAHRGSSAGARLLEHFEAYGRSHCGWVIMTLEAQSPVHDRTLTKRGYQPHERSFLLEVGMPAQESSVSGLGQVTVPCTPNDPLSLMR